MVASYFGGCSIAYSDVGVCHALSYGLGFCFHIHQGVGNCVVFNHLQDYYPEYCKVFQKMLQKNNVTLPSMKPYAMTDAILEKMIDIALGMEKPLTNALGPDWKKIMTRDKVKDLYKRIMGK